MSFVEESRPVDTTCTEDFSNQTAVRIVYETLCKSCLYLVFFVHFILNWPVATIGCENGPNNTMSESS
ncbi:unnamed protein product [Cylicocyclus nassatus]|uniref:Uncharacterized protein n=1 Tax=Cylicocyclus nassatus TaxID=53992 RepID=A0AA36GXB1_CYLNA|nr:unnamed protein product [Cylicocyclus nassatus]